MFNEFSDIGWFFYEIETVETEEQVWQKTYLFHFLPHSCWLPPHYQTLVLISPTLVFFPLPLASWLPP